MYNQWKNRSTVLCIVLTVSIVSFSNIHSSFKFTIVSIDDFVARCIALCIVFRYFFRFYKKYHFILEKKDRFWKQTTRFELLKNENYHWSVLKRPFRFSFFLRRFYKETLVSLKWKRSIPCVLIVLEYKMLMVMFENSFINFSN